MIGAAHKSATRRGARPETLRQYPKYSGPIAGHMTIGRDCLFNVPLTPVEEQVAPKIGRLPADISAQLKREFWRKLYPHAYDSDYTLTDAVKHAADDWLASQVKEFEREKIHRAFDEPEIRALADRWSQLCMRMGRLETMQDFARSVGIEPPEVKKNVTRVGAARRLSCPRWWRRQIRKHYLRRAEVHLRARGFVHKRRQVYASDRCVQNRRERNAAGRALLQELQAVSSEGDQLELWDVVQASQSNPALRRAELMTRLRGFEEVAQAAGHVAEFVTLTCPSAFHARHANGAPNERWQGFAPRDGQQWLCRMWARARAKLQRLSVRFYGFRIAEPHHDGTPHWHAVLFVARHHVDVLRRVLDGIWLSEYGDEPGARDIRSKFVEIDPAKGSACGYVAKYVAKNIDGFEVGDDDETRWTDARGRKQVQDAAESSARVAAWASAHGIRQFQQLGGPPVSVWRELRRLRGVELQVGAMEAARAAADAGEWAAFVSALGGIERGRHGEVELWTEVTGELSQYDELRGPQIAGVQSWASEQARESVTSLQRAQVASGAAGGDTPAVPIRVRTRTKCWRIQRKAVGRTSQQTVNLRSEPLDSGRLSSLGPVSITVRGSISVPSRPVAVGHAPRRNLRRVDGRWHVDAESKPIEKPPPNWAPFRVRGKWMN